jgi:epoxyqueuosine reductase
MSARWSLQLIESVRRLSLENGFALAGVAPAPTAGEPEGAQTAERFSAWVDAGHAGEMDYLKRRDEAGELLRRSARVAMPWARSVVVCAFPYNAGGPTSLAPAAVTSGWIARYAWLGRPDGSGTDYHDELLRRLRSVEAGLAGQVEGVQTRCFVDTGPLLERDFAARAGIGWTGKNTCTLNQKLGSWFLLAVIVTSLEMPAEQVALLPAPDRCGSCTRCLDACPTGALVAPRQMDASLCIAYLTIEKKGDIPADLREPMGRQVFGCDICQEVCPWNSDRPGRAPIAAMDGLQIRDELINPELAWLAALDGPAFRREFKGTPLERTKLRRIHRNTAIAMGNSGDRSFVPQLERWADTQDDPVLAEAAEWALVQLLRHADGAP